MEKVIVPCLIGWQISIKSLLALWENLQRKGFKYFLTNRLNQDCVENLFSIIRGSGGHRDNPNCEQFQASFRHIIVDKLFVHSPSANCAFDPDKILLAHLVSQYIKRRSRMYQHHKTLQAHNF